MKRVTETIDYGTKPKSLGAAMRQMPGDNSHSTDTDLKATMRQGTTPRHATKPEALKRAMRQ